MVAGYLGSFLAAKLPSLDLATHVLLMNQLFLSPLQQLSTRA
jgi:hypothetical protein